MVRCGRSMRWGGSGLVLLTLGLTLMRAGSAHGTVKYGPIQLSGSVDSQNLFRHHNPTNWEFVQQRNTALLRFDWDWLENGKLVDRYNIPFIKRSKLYLLYRGVYDSFYDIQPGGNQRGLTRDDDVVGGPISGNKIGTVGADGLLLPGLYSRLTESDRDALRFENTLREAYVDFKLAHAPLSFRVGRQQVIWGESDLFRLLDIWNPLDLTWHVQQEEWDKIRVPLWLVKGIWDIDQLGPLSNTFVEFVWNPGDFQPGAKVDFLPRPWAIPIPNPVRAGQVQFAAPDQPIQLSPIFNLQGTSLRIGDFERGPAEASDVGIRFHAVTPQGFEFTTNYLYIRGRGIGDRAGSPFGLEIEEIVTPFLSGEDVIIDPATGEPATFERRPVFPARVKAKFVHPYVHIFGLSGNYFEGNYTNTVFRLESAYALDEPFQTRQADKLVAVTELRPGQEPFVHADLFAPVGFTKRNVWAGMIGFDRPTWIRWLNAKTTYFVTGQFFWSYVHGQMPGLRGSVLTAGEKPYFSAKDCLDCPPSLQKTGIGVWDSGPFAGQVERIQDASNKSDIADNVRRWELLMTLATTSFYKGGTIVPFGAVAWDPVNMNVLTQFKLDYFYTNNFIIQFQQKFYTQIFGNGAVSIDPWGVGGLLRRRDETGVKITYQF